MTLGYDDRPQVEKIVAKTKGDVAEAVKELELLKAGAYLILIS